MTEDKRPEASPNGSSSVSIRLLLITVSGAIIIGAVVWFLNLYLAGDNNSSIHDTSEIPKQAQKKVMELRNLDEQELSSKARKFAGRKKQGVVTFELPDSIDDPVSAGSGGPYFYLRMRELDGADVHVFSDKRLAGGRTIYGVLYYSDIPKEKMKSEANKSTEQGADRGIDMETPNAIYAIYFIRYQSKD